MLVLDAHGRPVVPIGGQFEQELTGVVKGFRRRGIATRLKRIGLGWAISNGYESVRTRNDSTNAGMIAVNRRLGFRRAEVSRCSAARSTSMTA